MDLDQYGLTIPPVCVRPVDIFERNRRQLLISLQFKVIRNQNMDKTQRKSKESNYIDK